MKFTVLTLFPALIEAWKHTALVEDAIEKNLLKVDVVNPRDFSKDKHKNVDDKVYGGEDGMAMKAEPLSLALQHVFKEDEINSLKRPYVVALTPQGKVWQQSDVQRFLEKKNVILVCGRYAGFDQRFLNEMVDEEVSVGNYVLNGGEVAALAVMESVSRFIPDFLGHADSALKDSFSEGAVHDGAIHGPTLEAPIFTRPQEWQGQIVPSFLTNGNHGEREEWLKALTLVQTKMKRPDLVLLWSDQQHADFAKALIKVRTLSIEDLTALGLKDLIK